MKLSKMGMCNLIKRKLPFFQSSEKCESERTDIARQKFIIKEHEGDDVLGIREIYSASMNGTNLMLTANNGSELLAVNTVDGIVIIPEGITRIRKSVFENGNEITTLIIPSSVTTIDDGAFKMSSKIENIQVHTANKAFIVINGVLYDKDMTRVIKATKHCIMKDIPSSIKVIDSWAYAYCRSAINVIVPYNVTKIGERAFAGCVDLSTIKFLNSQESLGKEVFYECKNLIRVELPKNLRSIGYNTFYKCHRFREVKLPTSLEKIDELAFQGCVNIETIHMGSNLKFVHPEAFNGCSSLETIRVDEFNDNICDIDGVL